MGLLRLLDYVRRIASGPPSLDIPAQTIRYKTALRPEDVLDRLG